MNIDIEKELNEIDFESNKFIKVKSGLMLTNREVEILNMYHIDFDNCSSLKEILCKIEDVISDMDIVDDELDYISSTIAERDYYQNTNK